MLRKAFKVIGIAVLGAVFALGALAVSVVYIIPGMLAHEPEQKIALNSISCPPGMVENMRTGIYSLSKFYRIIDLNSEIFDGNLYL